MNRSARYFFLIYLLFPAASYAAGERVETEKSVLRFTLTVANPSDRPRLLTKVGVRSEYHGALCFSSEAQPLPVVADYQIIFSFSEKETVVSAEPPIRIPPHDFAKFTISIAPVVTGICAGSARSVFADVSVFAVFDNDARVITPTVALSWGDVWLFAAHQGILLPP